ncbi:MAG: T9SS type A sorting domain-containing protein, partial [Bacteroidota bacterium]
YAFAGVGGEVFAGTYGDGILHTTDSGANWATANNGLTTLLMWCFCVSGQNIYAGTYGGGVFLSTDKGASWTHLAGTGLASLNVTAILINGSNLFAGTWDGGMFLSTDNGSHFAAINTGLTSLNVNALISFPRTGGGINLVVGGGRGVFLSTDNGSSWSGINTGFDMSKIYVSSLAVIGKYILAGTTTVVNGIGLWRRPLSEIITDVPSRSLNLPAGFELAQNYPNPFNPSTRIEFSIPQRMHVVLKIYDLLGKEIATLIEGTQEAGKHSTTWDARTLPSDVYFYRLTAGSYTMTRKLLLLR